MSDYKLVDRKLMHKGKIVEFYTDYMQLPSKKIVEWDFLHHKGAAAIIPIDTDGKVIMVRQYRNAVNRYTLEIPAGGLNEGEDNRTCAIRELEEETGYKSNEVEHLMDLFTTFAFCDEQIGIYYATNLIPSKQNLDEDEFINLERYSINELTKMILDGVIQDSKTIAGLLAYKTKMGL